MSVSLALDILMGRRKMVSQEYYLPVDRAGALYNALGEVLANPAIEAVKLRIDEKNIAIIPICKKIDITL